MDSSINPFGEIQEFPQTSFYSILFLFHSVKEHSISASVNSSLFLAFAEINNWTYKMQASYLCNRFFYSHTFDTVSGILFHLLPDK